MAGRPTSYKEEYCEQIVEFMKDGASLVEFAAHIGVAKQTLIDWRDAHPKFSYAYKRGVTVAQAWYLKVGREGVLRDAEGRATIDTPLYKFTTAARFGMTEKVEAKVETDQKITIAYDPDKLGEEEE